MYYQQRDWVGRLYKYAAKNLPRKRNRRIINKSQKADGLFGREEISF